MGNFFSRDKIKKDKRPENRILILANSSVLRNSFIIFYNFDLYSGGKVVNGFGIVSCPAKGEIFHSLLKCVKCVLSTLEIFDEEDLENALCTVKIMSERKVVQENLLYILVQSNKYFLENKEQIYNKLKLQELFPKLQIVETSKVYENRNYEDFYEKSHIEDFFKTVQQIN